MRMEPVKAEPRRWSPLAFLLLINVAGLLCAPAEATAAKPRVAVVDFEAQAGVTTEFAALISDALRTEVYRTHAFEMIDRRAMSHMLTEARLRQKGVTEEGAAYIGKLKGIDKLVQGSIGRVESRYMVTARLVDLATARSEVVLSEQCSGSMTDLMKLLADMAAELAGKRKEDAPPVEKIAVMAFASPAVPLGTTGPGLGEIVANALVQGLCDEPTLHILSPFALANRLARQQKVYADTAHAAVATELARDVGATRIISGTVTQLGETWVITSVLTDTTSGRIIKSLRSVVGGISDILVSGLDNHLAGLLESLTATHTKRRVMELTTSSVEAYRLYVLGHDAFMIGEYKEAVAWLGQATTVDPEFAMAHIVRSCSYSFLDDDAASLDERKLARPF